MRSARSHPRLSHHRDPRYAFRSRSRLPLQRQHHHAAIETLSVWCNRATSNRSWSSRAKTARSEALGVRSPHPWSSAAIGPSPFDLLLPSRPAASVLASSVCFVIGVAPCDARRFEHIARRTSFQQPKERFGGCRRRLRCVLHLVAVRRLACFGLRHWRCTSHPPSMIHPPIAFATPPPCFSRTASICAALGWPLQSRHLPLVAVAEGGFAFTGRSVGRRFGGRGPGERLGLLAALVWQSVPYSALFGQSIPAFFTDDARAALLLTDSCTDSILTNSGAPGALPPSASGALPSARGALPPPTA